MTFPRACPHYPSADESMREPTSRPAWSLRAAMRIEEASSPLVAGICLVGAILALAAPPVAHGTTIGGIEFDASAFADYLESAAGTWYGEGTGLEDVLVGDDPSDFAYCHGTECRVTLGFTDNTVPNLEGADLAVFELGVPDTFAVGIGEVTHSYEAVDTGFNVVAGGSSYDLLVAEIDLDDFFVEPGGAVTIVDLFPDPLDTPGTFPATFTVVAAIHAVPEPTTALLLGLGLVGLAMNRRRPRSLTSAPPGPIHAP